MAGVGFNAVTDEIATGTDDKTLLQIVAAANHRVLIDELLICFKGTSNTDDPIEVVLTRQTSAGTMSALTLTKRDSTDDETLQTTAQHTATAEPTSGNELGRWYVHPQAGYEWQAPFAREVIVPGGTRVGVVVNANTSVNAVVTARGQE